MQSDTSEANVPSIITVLEKVREKESAGETVFNFSIGNPGIRFREAEKAHFEASREIHESDGERNPFSYIQSTGTDEAREGVAKYMKELYDVNFAPGDVVITNGGSEAGRISMICMDGDILLPAPTFAPALKWSENFKRIETVGMNERHHLDLDRLGDALNGDGKRKIVYIPNPSNPTGSILPDDEMNELVSILEKSGHFLIADVVYNGMEWDGNKTPTEYNMRKYNNIALIDSASKRYALASARLGWIGFHPDMDDKERVIKSIAPFKEFQGCICPTVTGCKTLPKLLEIDADTLRKHYSAYERRVNTLVDGLEGLAEKPDAAIYLWVKSPIKNDSEFAIKLIDYYNVATVPGSAFGGPGYVRFSVGDISEDDIREAVPRIRDAYSQHY